MAVVPAVQDEASQVGRAGEVAGEQLVKRGGGQRSAAQEVYTEPVARKGARDVDDLVGRRRERVALTVAVPEIVGEAETIIRSRLQTLLR